MADWFQAVPRVHLIVETNPHGHRLMYVALLAEYALNRGDRVLVATTIEARQGEQFRKHLGPLARWIEVVTVKATASLLQLCKVAMAEDALHVLIPDGDRYLRSAGMAGPPRGISITLLSLRPTPQTGIASRLRFLVKGILKAIARRRSVRVLDLGGPLDPCTAIIVPDPVRVEVGADMVAGLRRRYDITEDRFWFVVVGVIDARKNPGLVMRSIASRRHETVGLILAGQVLDGVASEVEEGVRLLRDAGIAVRRIEGYLTNEEFDGLIAAGDCCVAAYSNDGSSGVLGKSLAVGTRIVMAGSDTLRRQAELAGDGVFWCPLAEDALCDALGLAMESKQPPPRELGSSTVTFCETLLYGLPPVRIVQVLLSPRVGGAESVAETLGAEFLACGLVSHIVHLDPEIRHTPSRLHRYVNLHRALGRLQPTVIISHSAIPSIYARLAAPRRTSVVTVLHSATDDFMHPVLNMMERLLRRRTGHVIAVSGGQAENYRRHFGDAVPLTVVGNGLRVGSTKGDYRIEPKLIVTLARVASQKNPLLWLNVAKAVTARYPHISFAWYGPASQDADVIFAMRQAEGLSRITFKEATKDPYDVMAQADVLFHPSEREANSLTLLEAGALGLPIVCARHLVQDFPAFNVSGFSAGNVEEATSALLHVLEYYPSAARRAHESAPAIARLASSEAMTEGYLSIIAQVTR